jgi:hypothetical protein
MPGRIVIQGNLGVNNIPNFVALDSGAIAATRKRSEKNQKTFIVCRA